MSDQGDKIIHLAREVLKNGCLGSEPAMSDERPEGRMLTVKATALAALLAAAGSASLTHLVEEARRPISRYERVEIEALVFYTSRQMAISEDTLRHEIRSFLSLNSLADITVHDYKRVRNYLWERIQG